MNAHIWRKFLSRSCIPYDLPVGRSARSRPLASRYVEGLRAKANFACASNANRFVQSSREKYSTLPLAQISSILPCIPPREEGRIAIVTNVEAGSGGRATSQRASAIPSDK